jgi:hypothetical protein
VSGARTVAGSLEAVFGSGIIERCGRKLWIFRRQSLP